MRDFSKSLILTLSFPIFNPQTAAQANSTDKISFFARSALHRAAGNAFHIVLLQTHEQNGDGHRNQHTACAEPGEVTLIVVSLHPAIQRNCHIVIVAGAEGNVGCKDVITPLLLKNCGWGQMELSLHCPQQ